MEINSKQNGVVAANVASSASTVSNVPGSGKNHPVKPAEPSTVPVKAAPDVPEFEKKDVDKAVEDLRRFVEGLGRDLSFSQDESLNKAIITVTDSKTNELVRQIPAEEVVAVARHIKESLGDVNSGLLLDNKI